jgi:hypothetical protein
MGDGRDDGGALVHHSERVTSGCVIIPSVPCRLRGEALGSLRSFFYRLHQE